MLSFAFPSRWPGEACVFWEKNAGGWIEGSRPLADRMEGGRREEGGGRRKGGEENRRAVCAK